MLVSTLFTHLNTPVVCLHYGKPNPNDVILYLYTTYDPNSFRSISITSSPMILVHPRQIYDGNDIKIAALVKLQILEAGQIF